ncbi:MAG: HDIG domain-containing protein [Mucilaginibacter polytrichastri]|nr:HDIG domain-containing protein [Mucilaginibacter polytrichastri]
MNPQQTPESVTEQVFDLYRQFGNADYIGEPVSQIEHMVQAAALALKEGYDDEVVLGAFLHDIGHLCVQGGEARSMDGFGVADHETLGAEYLRQKGFSARVRVLVAGHVEAKRYLTYKDPEYYNRLSPASRETLKHQGGVMTPEEAEHFENSGDAELMIRMRHWDDLAKETNLELRILPDLQRMMVDHLRREQQ